jgi:hypothetical protein
MSFPALIGRALGLDGTAFLSIQRMPEGLWLALAVVLLAGISEAVGQSIVLFANRVKPRRFVVSLLLSGLLYTSSFVILTVSVWLVATYLYGSQKSLDTVTRAVGLGYAPHFFGFFILTPYFGSPIGLLLSLWSLVAIILALHVSLGLTLLQALVCSLLGWLLLQVLRRTIGRPVNRLVRWLRRKTAGVPLVQGQELRELLQTDTEER